MIIDLLREVSEKLEQENIPYMVSGSIAMLNYATSRVTRDVDIGVELRNSDTQKFLKLFESEFYLHPPSVMDAVENDGMFNIIDNRSCYKIDFVVKKKTAFRYLEFERKVRASLFDFEFWCVSVEDLILSKIIWIQDFQSEKQMEDIENLINHNDIDKAYILNWIHELKLRTFKLI